MSCCISDYLSQTAWVQKICKNEALIISDFGPHCKCIQINKILKEKCKSSYFFPHYVSHISTSKSSSSYNYFDINVTWSFLRVQSSLHLPKKKKKKQSKQNETLFIWTVYNYIISVSQMSKTSNMQTYCCKFNKYNTQKGKKIYIISIRKMKYN